MTPTNSVTAIAEDMDHVLARLARGLLVGWGAALMLLAHSTTSSVQVKTLANIPSAVHTMTALPPGVAAERPATEVTAGSTTPVGCVDAYRGPHMLVEASVHWRMLPATMITI